MGSFDNRKNVDEYMRLADGYDGRDLITVLQKHLAMDSTVLELGMGPGKDMDLLLQTYRVTGSDNSQILLDMYHEKEPDADLLNLDAVTFETERKFDCIYSNKVLHHLTKSDLAQSFQKQKELLSRKGLLMHSFWLGTTEEEHHSLRFVNYLEDELIQIAGEGYLVIEHQRYTEMEKDDSFYIILQKKEKNSLP